MASPAPPEPAPAAPLVGPRLAVGVTVAVAGGLRLLLWPWRSGDYDYGWKVWYERLLADGFPAFVHPFYDYNPPWPMMVWALTKLEGWSHGLLRTFDERMLLVKATAMSFDLLAAFLVHRLVREFHPGGHRPLYAACAVLLAPTVIMNAGMVLQVDGMYSSFAVAAVLATLRGRSAAAWAAFGAAIAFKLQAMFVAPFLLAAALRGRIGFAGMAIVPAVWLASLAPIWLAGRPTLDMLLIYA